MRLNQFDYFRAIAILFVVFSHTAQVLLDVYSNKSFTYAFTYTLIGGSTALFVFISGFFFHYIFYQRFDFKAFMLKKFKGVFIPYLFLTTLFFWGGYIFDTIQDHNADAMQPASLVKALVLYISHIDNGSVSIQFWYIPFIMLMFLASPILISYIKSATSLRMGIMLPLFIVSLIVHRPIDGGHTVHAFIFYLPIYLLGINCSIHRETINKLIKNKSAILGFIVIFLASIQILIFNHIGNYQKDTILGFNGISLMLIQKIFLIFFFLSLFQKYETKDNRLLKEIAASSFAIYFLHMAALHVLLKFKTDDILSFLPNMASWLAISCLTIAISYIIALTVKYSLERNSRFFTGW